ncbi:hypothetical protein CDAR_433041 [Caerostris darwini]|uniref:Uncharacterized protein n=1 Tax=Caerostris darwini TaxID=1538125 RepID=A0AAV4QFU9_9ARAC|nr:hypothetical protein CDAR_433041 [Caerostris darwini]
MPYLRHQSQGTPFAHGVLFFFPPVPRAEKEKYSLNVPTGPRNTTGMISQSMSIAGTYLLLPLRTRPGVEQAIFLLVHPSRSVSLCPEGGTLVMRLCGYNRKLAGWSLILT